ncbi:MAG TPA: TRAP transporter substrate-binding protein DctP [Verrucomicrobiae bacterium]|nr:TRAP transporter substrate-binding protein DctP [Verrucomicrobiae bacterium]
MKRIPILMAAIVAALALTTAQAAPRLKLGTLVPVGTSYHKSLMTMAEAWRKDSGGTVQLNVYAGGKLGGEAEMVGLMKLDSLQAALLTAVGLSEIEPGVSGLQNIPMGFNSLDEVDYVGEKLRPLLEERMARKGFVVLFWTDAGWVRFFSNKPVTHPADLKKLKLFTWSGTPASVEIYKAAGFDAVPLETADIVPSLQTGLIDAVPVPPFFAMASQIDERAPYMAEVNWAPIVGALVVRKETWEKIPAAVRAKLQADATTAGQEIKAAGRREMDESVAAMEKRGLKVTKIPPAVEAEWRQAAEAVYPKIRGSIVPEDIFDQAMKFIAEYRAQKK